MVFDIFGHTLGTVLKLFIVPMTSHTQDKGQVTVWYCGFYVNAHRGKMQKAKIVLK